MNLLELKQTVLFQTNNDADELGDFQPYMQDYLNEGYDRLTMAWAGRHVTQEGDGYLPLKNDRAVPELPDWLHGAIADWAAWRVYQNGSAEKQARGLTYRRAFETAERRIRAMTAEQKGAARPQPSRFQNIPR